MVENIEDKVEVVQTDLEKIQDQIGGLQKDNSERVTEESMTFFVEQVCNALQKELGEKVPHQPKHMLGKGSDAALKFDQSGYSQYFKSSMDRLAMKMEIIGSNIIDLKKHK